MSRQSSLEQERMQAAWQCINAVRNKAFASRYAQLARSAPADIQLNGLAQTVAFWRAKGKGESDNEHTVLYNNLQNWVKRQMRIQNSQSLLEWIMADTTTTPQYRRATREAIAFLQWLKRFAEAELSQEKTT